MGWARLGQVTLIAGVALALAGSVSACGSSTASTDPADLNGTWALVSYMNADGELVDVDPAVSSELIMDNGSCNGVGGVNTFTGSYEASDDGSISFGPQAGTLMAGAPEAQAQEDGFFMALEAAATFEVDGESLAFSDADGEQVATFGAIGTEE